jgi:hypothetical protein
LEIHKPDEVAWRHADIHSLNSKFFKPWAMQYKYQIDSRHYQHQKNKLRSTQIGGWDIECGMCRLVLASGKGPKIPGAE